jgi:hypothetical protein
MPTPSSSATSYASVADLVARVDVRVLQELASNDETPVATGSLASNTKVLTALLGASGEVESACFVGKQYLPIDLAALTGASLAYLKDIVCALALGRLFVMGRPDRKGEPPRSVDDAREVLQQLYRSERVFGLLEQQKAALLSHVVDSPQDVDDRRDPTSVAARFFGTRISRRGVE